MTPAALTSWLKSRAQELGFSLSGVCPAVSPPGARNLDAWLVAGYAGSMRYLAERQEAYHDPSHILDGVRSILMLAMPYSNEPATQPGVLEGRVARYAWGERDYHDVIRERLHLLADELKGEIPEAQTRGVVDTAPLMEREFAQLAGLGWIGKNTLLLSKEAGSYFFLAALLTNLELEPDTLFVTDHCGSCTACLEACPTDAFPAPYVLDARRCISYLTIEMHEAIPRELRTGMEDWVFGCDICQDVCPWNRHAQPTQVPEFQATADLNPIDLPKLFDLDDADFKARFRHTPLWRAHRRGLLRSAAIALGNRADPATIPALEKAIVDPDPIVRGAAAWALGQIDCAQARDQLLIRRATEGDPDVLREIDASTAT